MSKSCHYSSELCSGYDIQHAIASTDLSKCLQRDSCWKPEVPADKQFQVKGEGCQSQSGWSKTGKSGIQQTGL